MKKIIVMLAAFAGTAASAAETETIVLDLTKPSEAMTFDAETGAWSQTYNDDVTSLNSQCFSLVHSSMGEYQTWWGFTASNSADNSRRDNYITYQFSNMAKGGIGLNPDGTVMTDAFGAPVVSDTIPYVVAFYNAYFAAKPNVIGFNDGKAYEAVGVYVNLSSYPYYSIEEGDPYARAFTNGDKFTLTIHGVAPDESEKTVEVILAEYSNGTLSINRGWRYVDLSTLGTVNELYFTMESTDSGTYGMNTPGYFCLDKLAVRPVDESALNRVESAAQTIAYDRASHTVSLGGGDFAVVYDSEGRKVMGAEGRSFDISHLPAGVYVIRSAGSSLKIVK